METIYIMILQLITQHPESILEIIKRTPVWVWGLLAALLALGVSQLRDRQLSLGRVIGVPIGMLGFGLYGLWSAFGNSAHLLAGAIVWLAASLMVSALVLWLPTGSGKRAYRSNEATGPRFNPATGQLSVPGSAMPLLLILGIFMTKYFAGVELGMNPNLASDAGFVMPIGFLYGAFNGVFAGQALRLVRLARQGASAPTALRAPTGQWPRLA